MTDRTVLVKLRADAAQFKSEMSAAASSMSALDKQQAAAQARAAKWKAVGQTSQLAGVAVAAGLAYAAKAASNQEQAMGALQAVFKSSTPQMTEYAKAATNIGLSQTQYATGAAKLGSQLVNLGMNQTDMVGTTDDLINKSADMAAQFGGPTQNALDAVSAALRGERDPIENYGISLTEAGIKAEMAATGMDKLHATLALIQKQMDKAGTTGAAAREFDTTAAAAQRAKAQFDNAAAGLGAALLPAIAKTAEGIAWLGEKFNGLSDSAKSVVSWFLVIGTGAAIAAPKIIALVTAINTLRAARAAAAAAEVTAAAATAGTTASLDASAAASTAAAAAGTGLGVSFGSMAGILAVVTGSATGMSYGISTVTDKLGEMTGMPMPFEALGDSIRMSIPIIGTAVSLLDETQDAIARVGGLGAIWNQLTGNTEGAAQGLIGVGAASTAATGGLDSTANAAERTSDALKALMNDMNSVIDLNQAIMGSQDALLGQTGRLTAARKENGRVLQGTTVDAVKNRAALNQEIDLVQALAQAKGKKVADRTGDENKGIEASNAALQKGITAFRNHAVAAGYDGKMVDGLLKKLGLLDKDHKIKLTTDGASKAKKDLKDVNDGAHKVPKKASVKTNAPGADGAKKDLKGVEDGAHKVPRKVDTKTDAPGAQGSKSWLDKVASAARGIPPRANTNVTADTGGAMSGIGAVAGALGNIPRYIGVEVHVFQTGGAVIPGAPAASGGYIRGPGTETSDSVPASLSRGEYVVKAASVRKYGVSRMHALNAGLLPGFATGGSVDSAHTGYLDWAASMVKGMAWATSQWIETNMPRLASNSRGVGPLWSTTKPEKKPKPEMKADPTQKDKETDNAFKKRQKAVDKENKNRKETWRNEYKQRVHAWEQERANIQRDFNLTVRQERLAAKYEKITNAETLVAGIADLKASYRQGIVDNLNNSLTALSAFDFTKYADAVTATADASKELAAARQALNTAAPTERGAAAVAYREAASVYMRATQAQAAAKATPANVIKAFRTQAVEAEDYAKKVKSLQARHISSQILDQVASASPEEAKGLLDSLFKMSAAQLQNVNRSQARVNKAAVGLGNRLANQRYDADLKAARANVVKVTIAAAPVTLKVDGKTLAHVIQKWERQQGKK